MALRISNKWLQFSRSLWVAIFSLFYLLNLDQFGIASGMGPAPKYWIAGAFLITTLLFIPNLKLKAVFGKPVVWWSFGYLLLSLLWMGPADNLQAAIDSLMMAVMTSLYVGIAVLSYPDMDASSRLWRSILWLALLTGVISVLYEYINPSAYFFTEAGRGIAGRAAGFYLNPTIAAQAFIMILACMMHCGTRRDLMIATVVVLIGLFPTFSRGGFVSWAVLVALALWKGKLPKWFAVLAVIGMGIILFSSVWLFDHLSVLVSREHTDSLDRLAWMLGQGELNDDSSGERDYIASFGWDQFLQAPFLGHGLGYMWSWAANVGTHNMVLRHLVEYGMLGFLIFPCFLLASIRSAPQGSDRRWLWLTAGISMLLGIFSHNMLEQASFVFPWLAVCLMPKAKPPRANRAPR